MLVIFATLGNEERRRHGAVSWRSAQGTGIVNARQLGEFNRSGCYYIPRCNISYIDRISIQQESIKIDGLTIQSLLHKLQSLVKAHCPPRRISSTFSPSCVPNWVF